MKKFKHPPTAGINYCSILLWAESIIFLLLIPFFILSPSNINAGTEKIFYSILLVTAGILGIVTGKKLREAERWAWITAITFFFLTLGSPLLPFCAAALYILFKKNSVMYFTLPHIPKDERS